jgi:DNA helicase-2/ATP-dependent DNA helicase PcrA
MAGERKGPRQTELFGNEAGQAGAVSASAAGKAASTDPAAHLAGSLNPQQRAAVEHGEGPLLVVAGAGTGKTRVITERIRHLLESDPELPGEAIAGLTFTDKAAAEMKSRVMRGADERGEKVFLGTFHSFCTNLLVEHDPDLTPIEEVDHWILLRRNLPLLQLERYRKLAEPGHFLNDFVKFFSRCQDELVTPERYDRYVAELEQAMRRDRSSLADDERAIRAEEIAGQREIARAYRASDALLREQKRLTFGMQLLDAVRTLSENEDLQAQIRQRFRYILVDEFQDTNVAQLELLWLLAGEHRNIVAVGDDAQAIYRFRGASFGSFTIFLEKFAGVAKSGPPGAAERFVRPLVDNYRSTARVLRVAGQVTSYLEHSPLVPKKELVPHKNLGEKVRIVELGSAMEEARWIAAEIARLHGTGLPWRSFAALYRIHAHRDALVMALGERGIPFVIRNLSIMNHRLVLDVMAYLRLIARPSDDLACARVLAAPAWGLQPSDLVRLIERAAKTKKSLWETLQEAQGELPFAGNAGRGTDTLIAGINELRERARKLSAAELFDALADWLEIAVTVEGEDRRYVDRLGRWVREWQTNFERAVGTAPARSERGAGSGRSPAARLPELMEYLEYFRQAGGKIELEQDADDAVQLMTVHAAKGLEFDHVFVLRLTKGGFPKSARPAVLEFPEALMQEELPAWDYHTQEERRLFYVALTRARERLTLTTVVHPRSKPSLFLEDILSAPRLAREHVEQSAPKSVARPAEKIASREPLFADAAKRPRVYSRIADWALEYRPPVFEPLQLSVSAIEAYQMCPQKYLFGYVWGIRGGPHAAMTFGNVMHTTIREFLGALRKGRPLPPFEEIEAIFRREWSSAGFEDRYQEECYQKDGLEQLRVFHQSCVETPPDILAQEKTFALELENNLQVTGRIDQINFRSPLPGSTEGSLPGPAKDSSLGPGGSRASALGRAEARSAEVEIVDYKTGRPKTEEKARKDLQLGIYALAAREALELNATLMVYHSLQNNQRVAAGREAKQLADVRSTVQEVAAEIRARDFPPRPGFYCRSCDYRTLCPAQEAGRVLPEEDAPATPKIPAARKPKGKKPRGVTMRA